MDNTSVSRTWFRSYAELKAFDSLRAPIWVFDVDRHAMWWGNRSALGFWEVESVAELVARDFSSDSDIVRVRLRQIVENPRGAESVQETWTLFPHGRPTTVILDFKPILIDDGRQAVLIEASYPIDLDRDPDSLRILEAARNTPLLVSTFALDGRLLAQNPAATACYRRERQPGDFGEQTLAGRLADSEVAERIRASVAADRPLELDVEVRAVAGKRVHRIAARRGRDPISGETAIVLTEEDITDRVELEQALARANRELENRVAARTRELFDLSRRMSEEADRRALSEAALRDQFAFWQTLIDTIPAPIFYKDTEGRYLGCNAAFQNLIGVAREDIIGKTAVDVSRSETLAQHLKVDRELLARGDGIQVYETSAVDADEARRDMVVHKGTTRHGDGRVAGVAAVMIDVTELKRAEVQLREAQRLEAIGKLTGGVAHDFNNLLTVILGNLELLAETTAGDRDAQSLTQAALRAVDRGSTLTAQLLAYARKQPLSPDALEINGFVSEIAGLMERTLGESIQVETRLSADLPPALVDGAQLQNAILNLCLNARDALMPGGGRLTIASGRVRIEALAGPVDAAPGDLAPGDYVTVRIADTGGGMSAEVLAQATEPFFSTKEVGQGSGMGLSMAYGFARQSGGALTIESRQGAGTTVTLYLPATQRAVPSEAAPEGDAPAAGPAGGSLRILVVEDDPEVRRYVTSSLSAMGYRVASEATAEAALARLAADGRFALLFTDVVLPGALSGRDLAERAQRQVPGLKVLFTSGYPKDEIVHDGRLDPGLAFLAKPFRRKELSAALQRVIG